MKKSAFISGLALLMLAAGCQKEQASVSIPADNILVFGVSLDEGNKTTLNDNLNVLWKTGDKLLIMDNAGEQEVVTVDAQYDGKSSAQFTTKTVQKPPFTFFYPADAINSERQSINFPSTQIVSNGSFDGRVAVLAGQSETTSVVLSNLNSFMRVNLNEAVDGIIVENLEGRPIAGSFEVATTVSENMGGERTCSMSLFAISGTNAVNVRSSAPAKSFLVTIPEGRYSKGFAVKFLKDSKLHSVKTGTSGIVLSAGKITNMPELDCSLAKEEAVAKIIMTADELVSFLSTEAAEFTAEQKAVIGADIDLSGKTVPTATKFDGILDGQGYSIRNLSATNALVDVNNGTLMNLVIDESSSAEFTGNGQAISGLVCNSNNGVVEGCVNNAKVSISDKISASGARGAMIGQSTGTVRCCVNNGDFTVNVQSISSAQYYGGVVGKIAVNKKEGSNSFVSSCENSGNISINCPTKPGNAYIGGVLGGNTATKILDLKNIGNIDYCINKGTITYSFQELGSGTYSIIGGVVGNWEGSVNGCVNFGDVSYLLPYESDATNATCPSVGGVAGIAIFNVANCSNTGDIRIEGVWAAGTAGNAGAAGTSAPCFGGIVGKNGTSGVNSTSSSTTTAIAERRNDIAISSCSNMGDISGTIKMKSGGGTSDYLGGIVGMTNGNIISCVNEGSIDMLFGSKTVYVGGIVACSYGYDIKQCVNNADVTVEGTDAVSDKIMEAGIIALAYKNVKIDQCTNNGTITMNNNPNATGNYHYLAGIMANYDSSSQTITNCTNKGDIISNCQKKMRVAGITAAIYDATSVVPTLDPETQEPTDEGTAGTNPISGCNNEGNIFVTGAKGAADSPGTIVGGIAAYGSIGYLNCKNTGNITLTDCDANAAAGLFAGVANRRYDVENCTLDGSVSSNVEANRLGLFVGHPYSSALTIRFYLGAEGSPVQILSTANIGGTTPTADNIPTLICGGDADSGTPVKDKQILLKKVQLLIAGGGDTK